MDIIPAALTALASVIMALVAFIRFYLPRHDRQLHNPWAEELLGEMRQMRQENREHQAWERATLEELRRGIERLEGRK